MPIKRAILTLKKKAPAESSELIVEPPLQASNAERAVTVKATRRRTRYLCVVMGKERSGVTRIHRSLHRARQEAARLVLERGVDHVFVANIIQSAKLDGKEFKS